MLPRRLHIATRRNDITRPWLAELDRPADSILANTAASTLTSAAHAVSLTSANKGSPGFALRAPPPITGFLMRQKVRASNLAGEPERATADDMHDKI
jgi:hypothetical protein